MQAITTHAGLLRGLSVEQIWSELKRILTGPAVPEVLGLMERTSVLAVLFPEWTTHNRLAQARARLTRMVEAGAPADAVLRLAALVPEEASELVRRLKLSNAEAAFLKAVTGEPVPQPGMTEADLRRLLAQDSPEVLLGRTWLRQADEPDGGATWEGWRALRATLSAMTPPVFPLAGRDVLAAGYPPGPQVGAVLEQVRMWWLEEGCMPTREDCLAVLKNV